MVISKENTLDQVWQATLDYLHQLVADRAHPARRYGSLASYNGRDISQRTVVLRQVDEEVQVAVYTDSRSAKVASLRQYPQASLLLYDEQERFQLSMKATCRIHHQDELAHRHWQQLKGEAVKAYGSVLAPGRPVKDPAEAARWLPTIDGSFFCVAYLLAYELEVVQLDQPLHLRARFIKKEEAWQKQWLMP